MAQFYASKIVSALPSTLEANTLYLIRTGTGFDLHCSDSTGSIAHKLNPSGIQGPATSVVGNVAVFDNATGDLIKDRAVTTVNIQGNSTGTSSSGPELVTNGFFSNGSTGWTLGNGWTMVDGVPTFDLSVTPPGKLSTTIAAEAFAAYSTNTSVTISNPEVCYIEIKLGWQSIKFTRTQSNYFILTGPAVSGNVTIEFIPNIDSSATGTIKVNHLSCKKANVVPAVASVSGGDERIDFRQYRGSINIGGSGAYRTGSDTLNVSIGMGAAGLGISNSNSVFVGNSAGSKASSVWESTLVGYAAGNSNLGNFNNTLVGAFCGQSFWSGDYNTAIGHSALGSSRSGSNNSALGVESGYKTGTSLYVKIPTNCTYIGASTKASTVIPINETVLGANAIGAGDNTVQLGDSNVTLVSTNGQLKAALSYTNTSSDVPNLTIDSFGNIKRSTVAPFSLPDVAGNSGKFLSNDGTDLLWGFPDGTLPSPAGNSGKYLTTDGTDVFWDTLPGGSIAPGTIQYFATDPGAGWLKGDSSTYLRSSYPDLSTAWPPSLDTSPPVFAGDIYTTGAEWKIAALEDTDLFAVSSTDKDIQIFEWDGSTQSLSLVTSDSGSGSWTRAWACAAAKISGGHAIATATPAGSLKVWNYSSGGTLTQGTVDSVPSGDLNALAYISGGDYLLLGFKTADADGKTLWIYTRSGTSYTKTGSVNVGGECNQLAVSPSGKTLIVSNTESSKGGKMYDISGSTLTLLDTAWNAAWYTRFAFMPSKSVDIAYATGGGMRVRARMGNYHTPIIELRSTSQYDQGPSGNYGDIAISPTGIIASMGSVAPYLWVFRGGLDGSIKPMFTDDASVMVIGNYVAARCIFTRDNKGLLYMGSATNKIALIKSDTTKLLLPWAVQNGMQGWIKT